MLVGYAFDRSTNEERAYVKIRFRISLVRRTKRGDILCWVSAFEKVVRCWGYGGVMLAVLGRIKVVSIRRCL